MHVKAGRIAWLGLLAALTAVFVSLAALIETNTLCFLGLATFCIGIVIREWGWKQGAIFALTSTILCFLVAPNKIYVLTFALMGVYLLLSEGIWEICARWGRLRHRTLWVWVGRTFVFQCMYLTILIGFPELFLGKKTEGVWFLVAVLIGQVALVIYEMAYACFQQQIWGRMRRHFLNEENREEKINSLK